MESIDSLLEAIGGLNGACEMFGWQGGTIHQAKAEIKKRLACNGIVENRDGILVTLTIGGQR